MEVVVVALLGFAGALLRYVITELTGSINGFPVATLLINLSGCLVLGWFYTVSAQRMYVHPLMRLGIGTGFLGAFTTFSTFIVETWKLVQVGLYTFTWVYVLLTVAGGIILGSIGAWLARRQSRYRMSSRYRRV
jgi:fluoride exporter